MIYTGCCTSSYWDTWDSSPTGLGERFGHDSDSLRVFQTALHPVCTLCNPCSCQES